MIQWRNGALVRCDMPPCITWQWGTSQQTGAIGATVTAIVIATATVIAESASASTTMTTIAAVAEAAETEAAEIETAEIETAETEIEVTEAASGVRRSSQPVPELRRPAAAAAAAAAACAPPFSEAVAAELAAAITATSLRCSSRKQTERSQRVQRRPTACVRCWGSLLSRARARRRRLPQSLPPSRAARTSAAPTQAGVGGPQAGASGGAELGPALPSGGALPAGGGAPKQSGQEAVMGLKLERYTSARPTWK